MPAVAIKVLIVEDRAADADLMIAELKRSGFEATATRVTTLPQLIGNLAPDVELVIIGASVPGLAPDLVLGELASRRFDAPAIVVSTTLREDEVTACMRMGAADYVLKDRLARLGPAARHALETSKSTASARRLANQVGALERLTGTGSWTFDLETRQGAWSAEMARIFSHDPAATPPTLEEFRSKLVPESQILFDGAIAQALSGKAVGPLTFEVRGPDGIPLWVEAIAEPVRDPTGTIVGLRGTQHDVTNRKLLEAQRVLAQHQYRDLVELAPAGIFRATFDGRVEYVNPAMAAALGFPSGPALHSEWPQVTSWFATGDDAGRFMRKVIQGERGPHTFRMKRRDNSDFWGAITAYTDASPNGTERLLGVLNDVTAERALVEANAAAAAAKHSLDEILSAIGDVVFTVDLPSYRLSYISPGVATIWGRTPEEFYGHPNYWLETVHPNDKKGAEASLDEAVRTGASINEFQVVRPDGTVRWVKARVRVIKDEKGNPKQLHGIVTDTTPEREAHVLRQTVGQQGTEVVRLRELSEMRMQFLNVAAHDLNNPLTPMLLQLAVLQKDARLTEAQAKAIDVIKRNAQRLRVLVQDMLDSARLQAGKLTTKRAPTEVGPLVREAVESFQEAARASGLTLELGSTPTATANLDASKMSQVLFNLVGNACKYTPRGGSIEVGVTSTPQGITIYVQDTGLGLTAEQIGKMFAPFARFHEGLPGVPPGTGLGLFISKGIVEQHAGKLTVTSAGPGKGSRFEVVLPS